MAEKLKLSVRQIKKARMEKIFQQAIAKFVGSGRQTGQLATVTAFKLKDNLRSGTAFVTVLPESEEANLVSVLSREKNDLRLFLRKETSFDFIPDIEFSSDWFEKASQHLSEKTSP